MIRSGVIATFLAVFSFSAKAGLKEQVKNQIRVDAQLLVNGKVIPNTRIHVNAKMVDPKLDDIVLDMDLKFSVGDRQIHASPQVYVKAGEEALMTLEESSAKEKIQLKVHAKPMVR